MKETAKIKFGIIAVAIELIVSAWVGAILFCEDRAYDRHGIVIEELIK